MRINITGKHMDVTEAIKDLIEKKIKKFDKFFDDDTIVKVLLSVEKDRNIMEATIHYNGIIIRAEDYTRDMYSTVDQVIRKLEKQVISHKTKLESRLKKGAFSEDDKYPDIEAAKAQEVVKRKSFPIDPMSVDEAIMHMNLLAHSFYVFVNEETEKVNVIYIRVDGQIGLLEPEYSK